MKLEKIIKIISILLVLIISLSTVVCATSIIDEINNKKNDNSVATQAVVNTSNKVLGVLEVVGTGIAIVILLVLAIKYMIASADGKASVKKVAILYIVGAVFIFIAPRIASYIAETSQNITGKLI